MESARTRSIIIIAARHVTIAKGNDGKDYTWLLNGGGNYSSRP